MSVPEKRSDEREEWAKVEMVFNLIEAVGLAENIKYYGPESKR